MMILWYVIHLHDGKRLVDQVASFSRSGDPDTDPGAVHRAIECQGSAEDYAAEIARGCGFRAGRCDVRALTAMSYELFKHGAVIL